MSNTKVERLQSVVEKRAQKSVLPLLLAVLTYLFSFSLSAIADDGTVLVTGSNRGIGFEFTRIYAERGWRVIATTRNPDSAQQLNDLAKRHATIEIRELDATDDTEIADLAKEYKNVAIDLLINNAGILGDPAKQNFGALDFSDYQRVMDVNVVGVMKVTDAFLPNVKKSKQKKVVGITSVAGSIGFTTYPGGVFYAVSKAALNMTLRKLAADVRKDGVVVGIIEPNAVDTDLLAGLNFPNTLDVNEATTRLVALIDELDAEKSGKFLGLTYQDREFPW